MTKTIVISENVYKELKELKERWGVSFSEVIRRLLEEKFNTVDDLIDFVEKIEGIKIEKIKKEIWKDWEKKVEEIWKSA